MIKIKPYKNKCNSCSYMVKYYDSGLEENLFSLTNANPWIIDDIKKTHPFFPMTKTCPDCGALRMKNGSYLHKDTIAKLYCRWSERARQN